MTLVTDELTKHGKILGSCDTNSHVGVSMSLPRMGDILPSLFLRIQS